MDLEAPRYITLLGATGQIRAATYQERHHVVVPVVALVEGVLHPANIDRPEFVSAEIIAHAPQGWNGRPVVIGHPQVDGKFVSANSPEILETAVGIIFNAGIQDSKLILEAWLDKEKVSTPDTDAQKMMAKLEAGQMLEVSVGALVSSEKKAGVHKGKQYYGVWKHMVPDHIAFLRDGETGACSNEAGCGAPRMAMAFQSTPEGLIAMEPVTEPSATPEPPKKTLRERLFDIMRFRSNANNDEDLSDRDLREALDRSLRATEPGYLGIDSVFPNDNSVVYAVAPGDKVQLYRRSFKVNSDGEISLLKEKEEVHPVTRFEPVNAQSPGCGCAKGGAMDKAQRINALIGSGRFLETDRPWLEQIPEERLGALEAHQATTPDPKPTTEPPAPQPEPQPQSQTLQAGASEVTAEQYIAAAPKEIQESLREGLRVQQARRNEIITSLKATGRCEFTDEQLAAKQTCELERLLKLADVVTPNFVGRINVRTKEEKPGVPAPPSLAEAIRAARAK